MHARLSCTCGQIRLTLTSRHTKSVALNLEADRAFILPQSCSNPRLLAWWLDLTSVVVNRLVLRAVGRARRLAVAGRSMHS